MINFHSPNRSYNWNRRAVQPNLLSGVNVDTEPASYREPKRGQVVWFGKFGNSVMRSFHHTPNLNYDISSHRFLVGGGGGALLFLFPGKTSRLGRLAGIGWLLPVHLLLFDVWYDAALVVGKVVDDTRYKRPMRFILSQPTDNVVILVAELRSVTCHMGSHRVICHPTQVNALCLNPSQAGW